MCFNGIKRMNEVIIEFQTSIFFYFLFFVLYTVFAFPFFSFLQLFLLSKYAFLYFPFSFIFSCLISRKRLHSNHGQHRLYILLLLLLLLFISHILINIFNKLQTSPNNAQHKQLFTYITTRTSFSK